jgi:hypothetical protein
MCLPYLCTVTSVLSSQGMDGRGAVSRYYIACAHADGDRVISSPNLFREGGEGDIRTPNKKGAEGTHPLEATQREGHVRTRRERHQAKGKSW